jgi:hypothetical protein
MEISNSQIFSKFITPEAAKPVQGYLSPRHCGERSDEAIHKPVNSTNVCINTAIVAGAGALGGIAGRRSYNSDKFELQSSLEKLQNEVLQLKMPEKFKKVEEMLLRIDDWFISSLEAESEGKLARIPNCILVEGPDEQINNYFIKYAGEQSKCKFVRITYKDDILDQMEKAEEHFKTTKQRTLIHIKGFDQLINPKLSPNDMIAVCKDLMQCSSEDYHSTLIFTTKDSSLLDNAAMGEQRIEMHIKPNMTADEISESKGFLSKTDSIIQKIKDTSEKLKNLKLRTKIFKGAVIGLALGAIAVGIKYLISTKKGNNQNG